MKIDFDKEIIELTNDLKFADSYLECETIVLENIKKNIAKGISIPVIESYLKKLQIYFEDKMVINKGNTVAVNYKYASGFLNTINTTPYWHSWIRTAGDKY